MSTWALLQILVDIILLVGVFLLTMRFLRAPKDDPRLSRGLQLLQSKIAVLEDLSDRTESQVQQLNALMDQKCRDVQNKIHAAEKQVQMVEASMHKSMEVAKIFQDKIPHHEIIERQTSRKYVQAARLAHQGKSVEDIVAEVDLPRGEVELITKLNREQMVFAEEQLPWWAREEVSAEPANERPANEPSISRPLARDLSGAYDKPAAPSLQKLGEEFRKAVSLPTATPGFVEVTEPGPNKPQTSSAEIRPVQFRRIKSTDNLG